MPCQPAALTTNTAVAIEKGISAYSDRYLPQGVEFPFTQFANLDQASRDKVRGIVEGYIKEGDDPRFAAHRLMCEHRIIISTTMIQTWSDTVAHSARQPESMLQMFERLASMPSSIELEAIDLVHEMRALSNDKTSLWLDLDTIQGKSEDEVATLLLAEQDRCYEQGVREGCCESDCLDYGVGGTRLWTGGQFKSRKNTVNRAIAPAYGRYPFGPARVACLGHVVRAKLAIAMGVRKAEYEQHARLAAAGDRSCSLMAPARLFLGCDCGHALCAVVLPDELVFERTSTLGQFGVCTSHAQDVQPYIDQLDALLDAKDELPLADRRLSITPRAVQEMRQGKLVVCGGLSGDASQHAAECPKLFSAGDDLNHRLSSREGYVVSASCFTELAGAASFASILARQVEAPLDDLNFARERVEKVRSVGEMDHIISQLCWTLDKQVVAPMAVLRALAWAHAQPSRDAEARRTAEGVLGHAL